MAIEGLAPASRASDALDPKAPPLAIGAEGTLRLQLQAYEGKALRIKS